jgi:signal transduction histidine kinase
LENLLEWAQLQRGAIVFTPKDLSLSAVFSQSVASIKQRAMQKGVNVTGEIPETLRIFADEKMIQTILRNLLSNAVKFTRRGGKIVAKARETENGMVEISVTDSGVGIAKDRIGKLFTLGEKVNSPGTEGEPSSGLGLLLCKEFVEKHGGKIWAESEVENKKISKPGWSTFYFSLGTPLLDERSQQY